MAAKNRLTAITVAHPLATLATSPRVAGRGGNKNPFSRRHQRPRLAYHHDNMTLLDPPPAHKEGGGAPKGACRPLSAPHRLTSPSGNARGALAFRRSTAALANPAVAG